MELSDESPLQEWEDKSDNYEDSYEWVKESGDFKIRIEDIGDIWGILLFHKTSEGNLQRKITDESKEDLDSAIAQAEYYAENYKNRD